jgi:hypothetical protein
MDGWKDELCEGAAMGPRARGQEPGPPYPCEDAMAGHGCGARRSACRCRMDHAHSTIDELD